MGYRLEIDNETFKAVISDAIDKIEGRKDITWEEIVSKYNLDINPTTLRKAISNPFGAYGYYKYVRDTTATDELQEELGRLQVATEELREKERKIRQLNNKLSKSVIIAEDIKHFLKKDLVSVEEIIYKKYPPVTKGYKMIVLISDWHIGYTIKGYKGNNYNYKIAKERLGSLIDEIRVTCKLYEIREVVICQLGDIIENTYMRETQQAFECEFSMSEQISKAIKLLYEFAVTISEFANVRLISLGGNHSRISSKSANIEGDNANVIITEVVKTLVEISKNKRITVEEVDYIADTHYFKVNGLEVVALHGDKAPKDAKKLYDTEVSLRGERIDLIVRGHFHNFSVESQNNGAYVVTTGSLFGGNCYSERVVRANTGASQTLIIVKDKKIDSIKNVEL